MKKIIISAIIALTITVVGCQKFTDIQPKGKSLLSTAEDLDMLLNHDYYVLPIGSPTFMAPVTPYLVNTMLRAFKNIPNIKNETIKTIDHAVILWDESIDRAALSVNDNAYETFYAIIGKICNPVIGRSDVVTGSRALADRCKAEALVLRAWFHYLAVNLYAKAYDPATAATDGGVPYVFDTDLMSKESVKHSVAQVYEFILKDLQQAINLNALNIEGVNQMRVGKSFAYAVQAKVFMSMRRYDDALVAARASLDINNHIDNHNDMIGNPLDSDATWSRPRLRSKEDLFFTYTSMPWDGIYQEFIDEFDADAVLLNYMPDSERQGYDGFGAMLSGIPGLRLWMSDSESASFSAVGITSVDMRLTEAECLMRAGNLAEAKEKLEYIRTHRIVTDRYTPSLASTKAEIFALLKQLSRCDNFQTYRDFIDLKRWNTEPEFAATLTKTLLGEIYTLTPQSPLWIYPFPQSATNYNSNLTQNY
jgi:tetratricopeptide (TPR) repeat protein